MSVYLELFTSSKFIYGKQYNTPNAQMELRIMEKTTDNDSAAKDVP